MALFCYSVCYAPHFFLGKSGFFEVKCSASMFVVDALIFLSQLRIGNLLEA
jgi:hypothetical protein